MPNPPLPIRHHYVPRFILKGFAEPERCLYVWNKADGSILISTPKKIFVEPHLYSSLSNDGLTDVSLERAYSILEGRAGQIVCKIIAGVRMEQMPVLSSSERQIWATFFHNQVVRVPEFFQNLRTSRSFSEFTKSLVPKYEARCGRKLTGDEWAELVSPEFQDRVKQNSTVGALRNLGPTVPNLLAKMSLQVGITVGQSRIAIGSQPVVGAREGAGLLEAWLPISPSAVVRHVASDISEPLVHLDDGDVEAINQRMVAQSEMIASGSPEHLLAVCAGVKK